MKNRRGNGLTLIELLVCLAILAIVAAIAWPIIAKARNKAEVQSQGQSLLESDIGEMSLNVTAAINKDWTGR